MDDIRAMLDDLRERVGEVYVGQRFIVERIEELNGNQHSLYRMLNVVLASLPKLLGADVKIAMIMALAHAQEILHFQGEEAKTIFLDAVTEGAYSTTIAMRDVGCSPEEIMEAIRNKQDGEPS